LRDIDISTILNIFDNHVDPVVITDANIARGVKIIYVNNAFCRETGYKKDEVIGKSPKILQGEKSDRETLRRLKRNLKDGVNFVGQTTNYRKDGSEYIVQWSVAPLKDKKGTTVAFISLQKILTKLSTTKDEKLLLKAIIEHAPGMILVTDLEGIIIYANNSFIRNTGYSEEELIGNDSRLLQSGKQSNKFYEKMWEQLISTGRFEGLLINKKKDGTLFYDKKKITVIKDEKGNPRFYLAVSYDVTKEVENEKNLKKRVYTDALTGLYNREKYNIDIKRLMQDYREKSKPFSIILFDIDNFKSLNDNLGHDIGDFILQELAKLISQTIRSDDDLYRWGGEEFVLLVQKPLVIAVDIAKKLNKTIKNHNFNNINITASFGVAQITEDTDTDGLFKKADIALYQAKKSGRDKVVASELE